MFFSYDVFLELLLQSGYLQYAIKESPGGTLFYKNIAPKWSQRFLSEKERQEPAPDLILCEEPLEIRALGEPLVTTMRTPGDDHKLAVGFLFAEGLIRSLDDLLTVTHCGRLGEEGYGNVLDIIPANHIDLSLGERLARRGTISTSSCGVCGRQNIQQLLSLCGTLSKPGKLSAKLIASSTEKLSAFQRAFSLTGGSHAAVALDHHGVPLCGYEDIGRHNAVDKVIGALLYEKRLMDAFVLVVSGRVSFEIVQKAAVAKIPLVASISAASTMAIELAEAANITLAAFVRNGGFTLYTHPERLE
jgi:FdhD protein